MAERGSELKIQLADSHLRRNLDFHYNQISGASLGYIKVLRDLNVPEEEIKERLNRINTESLTFIHKITEELRSELDNQGGEHI